MATTHYWLIEPPKLFNAVSGHAVPMWRCSSFWLKNPWNQFYSKSLKCWKLWCCYQLCTNYIFGSLFFSEKLRQTECWASVNIIFHILSWILIWALTVPIFMHELGSKLGTWILTSPSYLWLHDDSLDYFQALIMLLFPFHLGLIWPEDFHQLMNCWRQRTLQL